VTEAGRGHGLDTAGTRTPTAVGAEGIGDGHWQASSGVQKLSLEKLSLLEHLSPESCLYLR
jgi:hypothetical protein